MTRFKICADLDLVDQSELDSLTAALDRLQAPWTINEKVCCDPRTIEVWCTSMEQLWEALAVLSHMDVPFDRSDMGPYDADRYEHARQMQDIRREP